MLSFACKDLGMDCTFVATGETAEEVMKSAFAHAGVVHKDILAKMSKEEMDGMTRAVEAAVKPA